MTEEDYRRMLPFSSRIRAFDLWADDRVSFSEEDVQAVRSWNECLFPRLRVLCSRRMETRDVEFILASRGNSFTDVELDTESLSRGLMEAVRWRSLAELEFLKIEAVRYAGVSEATAALVSILREAVNLAELSLLIPFVPQLWEAITSLPDLRSYHFRLVSSDLSFLPSKPRPFTSLSTLSFSMPDIASTTLYLKRCTFPQLQKLDCSIVSSGMAHRQEVSALVDAILTACYGAHLVAFELVSGYIPELHSNEVPEVLDAEMLRSFFGYRHMQRFILETNWSWAYDNTFIRDAAVAWPEIQKLYLDPNSWSKSEVTLQGLRTLALHCPLLQSLGAHVNGCILPHISRLHTWRQQTTLVEMDVGTSVISSPTKVAEVLAHLFPELREIQSSMHEQEQEAPDDAMHFMKWERVGRILADEASEHSEDGEDGDVIYEDEVEVDGSHPDGDPVHLGYTDDTNR